MRNLKHVIAFLAIIVLWIAAPVVKASAQQGSLSAKEGPGTVSTTPADPAKSATKPKAVADSALVGYTIGEQDVLDINVWKEKELSGTVVVRPDGKITLPLVNEVDVVGKTPLQLQQVLTERLQPFLTAPQVTVSVREINSRKVYLIGQVAHDGVFRINSTTTVFQILAQAGGLGQFAKRKKIYVLRNENGKQVRLPFNYDAVVTGQNNSQDFVLKPNDTIVVP